MSSDFEGYEQDFAVLTAEITGKIARVPRLPPEEKKQMVANVEKQLEEAKELLEQMDLEVREIPPQSRGMYSSRMRSYKQEMGKLEKDFKRSRIAYSDEVRNELLGDDGNSSENQRAHLLDNTERLERSSRRLEAGYQIAVETEQIGQEMLENLSHDREKIQRARERLRETDANLGKSSRVLTGMLRRCLFLADTYLMTHTCSVDEKELLLEMTYFRAQEASEDTGRLSDHLTASQYHLLNIRNTSGYMQTRERPSC
ncbi:vesicle transport through interaction with t-SNAREs homolog 1A isoform X2 [Choloepus didactylus]|uniref:vesicle transport through interaction with t-SNAREs homolog 1A isoform X2 n=2 Tax=Choloepus didactylus TaxID=27675 RepID=UPI0018A06FFA|nr:vesicle transport through interaction with t-SNAREs homolog 1A isoform X2 [Choloepus didactylus]